MEDHIKEQMSDDTAANLSDVNERLDSYKQKTDQLLAKLGSDPLSGINDPIEWITEFKSLYPVTEAALDEGNQLDVVLPYELSDDLNQNYLEPLLTYLEELADAHGGRIYDLDKSIDEAMNLIDTFETYQDALSEYLEFLKSDPKDLDSFNFQFNLQDIESAVDNDANNLTTAVLPTFKKFAEIDGDEMNVNKCTYYSDTLSSLSKQVNAQLHEILEMMGRLYLKSHVTG